ncbi:MAG: sigma-70 family RNA polymerase sigma factor [Planctomycetes bacterium]|nr:sigma-70 family RNA polymerase sigma factor [Planctomycetota bacterium]MBL7039680.1 sigma-70 family RNA polymerase sigma factor [Pirellulaceae bacterium]
MTTIGSVSQLIAQFKDGDEDALAQLHHRYWPALVNMARKRLRQAPIAGADEEDVAQSALIGFYKTVQDQRAPQLANRHHLLALLSHIVACKAINRIKHAMTLKQGQGKVQSLTPIAFLACDAANAPDEEAILHDCYEKYVGELPDHLRDFAELHLAGLTNKEIAERLGCVQRTVERKLALLRDRWQELPDAQLD